MALGGVKLVCLRPDLHKHILNDFFGLFGVAQYLERNGKERARRVVVELAQSVPMPPETTDATGPNTAATPPDSKAPSSLDEMMNRKFTACTRPMRRFGVKAQLVNDPSVTVDIIVTTGSGTPTMTPPPGP